MQRLVKISSNEQIKLEASKTFYIGIDPTAASLHIGHLIPYQLCRELLNQGHKGIFLFGGFTATIGDPTDKMTTRSEISFDQVNNNTIKIQKQVTQLFKDYENQIIFCNNSEWLSQLSLKEYSQFSKYASINYMLSLHTYKTRIENHSHINALEFSYPILQAYDWYILYKKYQCTIQIGGGDQWGNLAFGVKILSAICKEDDFLALATPLLTSNGEKIGKTTANAPFINNTNDLYQYCINLSDDICNQMIYYLNVNTNNINQEKKKDLFYHICKICNISHEINTNLYSEPIFLTKLLVNNNLCSSISEAKRLIKQNACKINEENIATDVYLNTSEYKIVISRQPFTVYIK